MTLSALEVVELLAAYHAGLLGLWLVRQRGVIALGLLSLVFSAHMLANLGTATGVIPPPLDPTSAFGLLYGPLLYLLIRTLVRADDGVVWRDAVHSLPALAIVVVRPALPVPQLIGFPLLIAYLWRSGRLLAEHQRLAPQLRADDAAVDLGWVRWTFAAFVALAAVDITRSAAAGRLPGAVDEALLAATLASVVALVHFMGLRGAAHQRHRGAIGSAEAAHVSTGTTVGDASSEAALFPLVDRIVRQEALWREPRLSLARVAERSGLGPRDVSRAINVATGCSFSRYVNGLRIDAFEALASDPEHADRALLDLALEVGFNAKSTFNRIYREHRGVTPSQVRNPRPES
ncbi:MAG: helix-turn-helix transcriptional regulator [Pseudomonadota bacterium]